MKDKIQGLLKPFVEGAFDGLRGASGFILKRGDFAHAARAMKEAGARLVAEWASDASAFGRGFSVYAAYCFGHEYVVARIDLPADDPSFQSITRHYAAAFRFERQIRSLMGLVPAGHPDMRPWIAHEDWPQEAHPLRKSFDPKTSLPRTDGEYKWIRAEGEGVFEVPVGPVHAGIIEPGHFRFQAVGEDIINLETRFGYVHKGIEKRFESLAWADAVRLAGRVSGDSTVAHAGAMCMAMEAASGTAVPSRAAYVRAVMLERERIANHLGDIGAICNDTAFAFLHCQFSILRERILKTNREVFGHRLMMDGIVPGGVAMDISRAGAALMREEALSVAGEVERLVRIYEGNPSMEDRLYSTGVLTPDAARELGVVGFVARSSGQRIDARVVSPCHPYDRHPPKVHILSSGDVHARAWVRVEEVRDSLRLLDVLLGAIPEGPLAERWEGPAPGVSGFAVLEGWRGEVVYWVECGPAGAINRCMVRDPSSVNWLAIEQAIKGNIVPDFPLCNKSFNQSYSGHDL